MPVKQETQDISLNSALDQKVISEKEAKQQKEAIKRYTEIRCASAWSLHRVPLEKQMASKYITKGKTKLVLPKSYRATGGEEKKLVRPHDDLNAIVFGWYDEQVSTADNMLVNFVTKDGVTSRRHEYLGPDPRVAGYEVGFDGEIHIRWWDAFLHDQWMGKESWTIEVVHDARGEWIEEV